MIRNVRKKRNDNSGKETEGADNHGKENGRWKGDNHSEKDI